VFILESHVPWTDMSELQTLNVRRVDGPPCLTF